jgi:phosphoenolpyruvate carboxykinase (ATP)
MAAPGTRCSCEGDRGIGAMKQPTDVLTIAASLVYRPRERELRALTDAMPNASQTVYGNVNVRTSVGARQRSSTFIVSDEPDRYSDPTMPRSRGQEIARLQDEYVATREMVVVDGFFCNAGPYRMPTRLVVEKSAVNIAAMQRHLLFDPMTDDAPLEPALTVICTPSMEIAGFRNNRVIAVWLDEGVTRVINSDYFDESKKAGLRMWSSRMYDYGGLVLHAGCKVIPSRTGLKSALILGLPDSGKSTITFTQQNGSRVLQDDFVALLEGGEIVSPQDGCIEKTYGLEPRLQPEIYAAVTSPDAYLENVLQRGNVPDFSREADRRAGRAVFNLRSIDAHPRDEPVTAAMVLFLNREKGVLPAVSRLDRRQAVRQFLLRELRGWTAKDAHGEGSLPGPRADRSLLGIAERGDRFARLLASHPIESFLLNTGWVGGERSDPRSRRIPFDCSFAILQALADETVGWESSPELGLDIAGTVPGMDDDELLQPRRLYEGQGRSSEYLDEVDRLRMEWRAYLAAVPLIGSLDWALSGGGRRRGAR